MKRFKCQFWREKTKVHGFELQLFVLFCSILISHPCSSFSLNSLVLVKPCQSMQRLHLHLSSWHLHQCYFCTPASEGVNCSYHYLVCYCSFPCLGDPKALTTSAAIEPTSTSSSCAQSLKLIKGGGISAKNTSLKLFKTPFR